MNRYNHSIEYTRKANPTQKTQEAIFEVINKSEMPMTLTAIATKSGKGLYATEQTIDFLERFGLVEAIISSGGVTIIRKKEGINGNAINQITAN